MNTYTNGGGYARPVFSNLSTVLCVGSVISLLVPYVAVPVAVMSIIFGVLSILKKENRNTQAAIGIAVSAGAFLVGATLIICLAALSPYMEDITKMFSIIMPLQ